MALFKNKLLWNECLIILEVYILFYLLAYFSHKWEMRVWQRKSLKFIENILYFNLIFYTVKHQEIFLKKNS